MNEIEQLKSDNEILNDVIRRHVNATLIKHLMDAFDNEGEIRSPTSKPPTINTTPRLSDAPPTTTQTVLVHVAPTTRRRQG